MTGETEIEITTRLIRQLRKRRKDWNPSQTRRRNMANQINELADVIESYNHVEQLWSIYDVFISKETAETRLEDRMKK